MMRFYRSVVVLLILSLFVGTAEGAKRKRAPKKSAREAAELLLPRYRLNPDGQLAPDVRAAAAIVYDPLTGTILYEQNAREPRSIASITKVMTATVFMEDNPDLTQQVTVTSQDVLRANHTYLRAKDRVTVDDLLHLMLISSDNAAARVLARVSGPDFVDRMNDKAEALGLRGTKYADPSGLLSANVSTAFDMARLISMTGENDYISSIMRMVSYTVRTFGKRTITFRTTDHLLVHEQVLAAKTGYIGKSGYCFASMFRTPSSNPITVVVLGATSNVARFLETQNLLKWYLQQVVAKYVPPMN